MSNASSRRSLSIAIIQSDSTLNTDSIYPRKRVRRTLRRLLNDPLLISLARGHTQCGKMSARERVSQEDLLCTLSCTQHSGGTVVRSPFPLKRMSKSPQRRHIHRIPSVLLPDSNKIIIQCAEFEPRFALVRVRRARGGSVRCACTHKEFQ